MPKGNWLDPEQQEAWRALLATWQLLDAALDRQLQRDAGMPHAYYMVLAMLSEAPARTLRMTDLAQMVQSSQSRMSHAIARLEERGWVRREPCATDKRGQNAVLTDAGYAVLEAAAPGHVQAVRDSFFDQLSVEQVRQLREICGSALAKLDPDATALGQFKRRPAA
ncbi:MAG TPA: MarR family transcriptional regulator [Rugosimonospora sp.]|nr:MarR family transcriptional regulator [Rugosimonospora sp.]